jgi:type I restriction-modification system DNA methylase subunit
MISLNEIRSRAKAFAVEWKLDSSEDAEAKSFWDDFFNVFGVSRRRVASFEYNVNKRDGAQGFVDVLWKGVMLAEHKSRGKDLDKAYTQAKDYFPGLKDAELPRYIVVSDFARIRLYDLEDDKEIEFALEDLHKNIELFGFISGYEVHRYEQEEAASIKAAQLMAEFHNEIAKTGYSGHDLEVFLVRILFCLFADDTEIFSKGYFRNYVTQRTNEDGSDLGSKLLELFDVLNKPENQRQSNLDEQLAAFPYINGAVFGERISSISLDKSARDTLLKCCSFDWSAISAAIFGSLFQGVMDDVERRQLGAHYTSEINIRKVIEPLFLDELYNEFDASKRSPAKLKEFHNKLASLKFLDPACGCGNFLVTTYRELRSLELQVLKRLRKPKDSSLIMFGAEELSQLHVNQFYGIEIEEFPALVARTAMYLADHQANLELSKEFGVIFARIPLEEPATIINKNALTVDWKEIVSPSELDYIIGNPPFVGAMVMSKEQREDLLGVFGKDFKNAGILDFVSAWYLKAAEYIKGSRIKVGLVSTNSITQGEQVNVLWSHLIQNESIHIHFAHRTFKWKNEAKGNAAVFCVIIGFASYDVDKKYLYSYKSISGEPVENEVTHINPFLVEAPDIFIHNRPNPLCNVPKMRFGSMPRDGGNLIFSEEEKDEFLKLEPGASKFIRPYTGAQEFINGYQRYCLWLVDIEPSELKNLTTVIARVEATKNFRLASKAESTRKFAKTPAIFCQIAQPDTDYLLIPRVSSERRSYIPIGYLSKDVIANDQVLLVPEASLFHFGVLTSLMHMSWMRTTCGRLKSDYRYSKDVVYNNFPWPDCKNEGKLNEDLSKQIEDAANVILDVRAKYSNSTLADLYDPNTMPPDLTSAHDKVNRLVDKAYGFDSNKTDAERLTFLFDLYINHIKK